MWARTETMVRYRCVDEEEERIDLFLILKYCLFFSSYVAHKAAHFRAFVKNCFSR